MTHYAERTPDDVSPEEAAEVGAAVERFREFEQRLDVALANIADIKRVGAATCADLAAQEGLIRDLGLDAGATKKRCDGLEDRLQKLEAQQKILDESFGGLVDADEEIRRRLEKLEKCAAAAPTRSSAPT